MSSWSAPVYPRRSRSRSPYRGYPGRPPYPDPYGGDPYRLEWDAYDRDRWAGYERERGPYDYGRRGRSRSPDDGTGRKRRRSASPWDRDRYEPRPRYDDYDPHRGGYSPRRSHHPSRPTPQDPHTLDYPASLKQYAEWFRYFFPQQAAEEDSLDKQAEIDAGDGSKPRNGIRSKWEKYKKDFASNQLHRMFEHHRKSPWFAEKYEPSPEFLKLRERLRREGWKGRINAFISDLEQGKFDSGQGEAEPESVTKEPVPSGAFGENADSAIGPAAPEDVPNVADDEIPGDEEDGNENEGVKSTTNGRNSKTTRGDNRGEEFAVMPEGNQVMIRTIPPDIGRLKLEEACRTVPGFIYLALGDPLQKRNYYRAGWIKFKEDADMPAVMTELAEKKIEGFKLHLTHNLKPFTNRIRYAPEVASRPDRLAKDLANAKTLASLLEDEHDRIRRPPPREDAPPQDDALDPGSHPQPTEDTLMADGSPEHDPDEDAPKSRGSEAVERRIEKVISDLKESGAVDVMNEREFEAKKDAIALDLYISYLRAAFNTCFYCAVVTDHVEELQRKCVKHVRKPMSKAMIEEVRATTLVSDEREARETESNGDQRDGDEELTGEKPKVPEEKDSGGGRFRDRDVTRADIRWLEWFDSKIAVLINRDGVDPRDYGGKDQQEELVLAAEPYVRQEGEGKFRCKHCQKLFIASSFVEKHVANKHPELLKHLDDIPYFNNFAMDPHRIQPFTHAPTNIGNGGQQPPPQAFGLQGHSYPPPDYGRLPPPHHGYGAPMHPVGYWEYHQPPGYGSYPPPPPRRLSDRISGYAKDQSEGPGLPIAPGLPPKPVGVDQASNNSTRRGSGSRGNGPLPPPPVNAKEDPRASAGKKVSYHDMDLVAEGDVELNY